MCNEDHEELVESFLLARAVLKHLIDFPDERPDPGWVKAVMRGIDAVVVKIPLPSA